MTDDLRWKDFPDRAMFDRFQIERFRAAAPRQRWALLACAVVSMALGWYEAHSTNLYQFEGLVMQLHIIRSYIVVPVWVALALATFAPGFPRRANRLNAVAVVLTAWAHSLITWLLLLHSWQVNLANALMGSTILVLVVAVFIVPMRLWTLGVTVVLAVGVPLLVFWLTFGGRAEAVGALESATLALSLVAGLLMLGGWFRDSAEKRTFLQREQARYLATELARRDAEKDEYMALAAHDLRSPLAAMQATLIAWRSGRLNDAADKDAIVDGLCQRTGQMMALIDDILNANAAEDGALPVQLGRVDLGGLLQLVAAHFERLAAAKQQRLLVHPPPGPVWVLADEPLVRRIADNFVSNALKFSPAGTTVELEVQVAVEIRRARLVVSDQGPGISAGDQTRLFRLFGRAAARPTGGEPSSGLGLVVVKRLAEAMQGRAGCESVPGLGASFWVELQLAP